MALVIEPLGSLLSVSPSVKLQIRRVVSKIPSALKMDREGEEVFPGNTSWPYKSVVGNTDF